MSTTSLLLPVTGSIHRFCGVTHLSPNHSRPLISLRLSSDGTCESRAGLVAKKQAQRMKYLFHVGITSRANLKSFGFRACANAEHTDHTLADVLYELFFMPSLHWRAVYICLPMWILFAPYGFYIFYHSFHRQSYGCSNIQFLTRAR